MVPEGCEGEEWAHEHPCAVSSGPRRRGRVRMRSNRPKPLHHRAGARWCSTCSTALAELDVDRVVVVVRAPRRVGDQDPRRARPRGMRIEFVEQATPRGTGDAVAVGLTGLSQSDEEGDVVVLPRRHPAAPAPTSRALVRHHRSTDAGRRCSRRARRATAMAGWFGARTSPSPGSSKRPTPPTRTATVRPKGGRGRGGGGEKRG